MAVEVNAAVGVAYQELSKLLGRTPLGLRLEEVEFDGADDAWLVTLGYLEEEVDPNPPLISPLIERKKYERVYRVFRIGAVTGDFRSMKLRQA